MSVTDTLSVKEMAAATPATRDRYVDLLRAFSIAVVVLGHWLMAIIYFDGSGLTGDNALEVVPVARLLTWVLQVMPLFFFVGGFSNLTSWRSLQERGGTYFDFVSSRASRLMRPCAVFIGSWLLVALGLEVFAASTAEGLQPAIAIIAKPLWFIAVYLIVIALAPPMIALHRRFGIAIPIAMAISAAAIDVLRLSFEVPLIGYLNFAFVWLFAHQLGFFYADGAFDGWSRRRLLGLGLAGLVSLIALTTVGPYSESMVGVADGKVSNNDPPSVCIVAHSLWLIGLAMTMRKPVTKWLQNARNWSAVIAANSVIMTVFLWHLTALLVGVLVLYPLGFPQPAGGTGEWWLLRPVWMVALALLLVPFVIAFARFERPRSKRASAAGGSLGRTVAGVAALSAGIAGFATTGFTDIAEFGGAATNGLLAAVGIVLLHPRERTTA